MLVENREEDGTSYDFSLDRLENISGFYIDDDLLGKHPKETIALMIVKELLFEGSVRERQETIEELEEVSYKLNNKQYETIEKECLFCEGKGCTLCEETGKMKVIQFHGENDD